MLLIPGQEDMDNDGSGNNCDNCPDVYNPGQGDLDGDDVGNECDNCPSDSNPLQEDSYPPGGNNCGDACECHADCNGDQTVNLTDLVMMKQQYFRTDCATNPCSADCNYDNCVDLADLVMMKSEFFKSNCPVCP